MACLAVAFAAVVAMAWHFGLGDPARAVQNGKAPTQWPLVVSARPWDSPAAVPDRKTTRPDDSY